MACQTLAEGIVICSAPRGIVRRRVDTEIAEYFAPETDGDGDLA